MDTPIEYRDGRHMSQAVRIGSDLLRQVAEIADKTRTNRADLLDACGVKGDA